MQVLEKAYQQYRSAKNIEAEDPSPESIARHELYLANLQKMQIGGNSQYMCLLEENYLADVRTGRDNNPITQHELDKTAIQTQQRNSQSALESIILSISYSSSQLGGARSCP